jgi:predicted choloylglycine hydrolase
MRLEFDAISEATPGPKWRRIFVQSWPGWREWQRRKAQGPKPSLAECERALGRYMPELLPVWRRMVELTGENEAAARFLSFWCPPRYLVSCSQAALIDEQGPFLIRNYDLDPAVNEATILHSAWNGASGHGYGRGDRRRCRRHQRIRAGSFPDLRSHQRRSGLRYSARCAYLLEVCNDAQDAVEALRSVPCHMSYNVTVMDSSGKFATVFLSPDRPAIVSADPASTTSLASNGRPTHADHGRSSARIASPSCLPKANRAATRFSLPFSRPRYSA